MLDRLRQHIEVPILIIVIAALAALWWISRENGLAVIELVPILIDYAVGMIPVILLAYGAWLAKREYWHELSDEEEAQLVASAATNPRALWIIILDRVSWVVLFVLGLIALQIFSGR